jgi:hypothetical protein
MYKSRHDLLFKFTKANDAPSCQYYSPEFDMRWEKATTTTEDNMLRDSIVKEIDGH